MKWPWQKRRFLPMPAAEWEALQELIENKQFTTGDLLATVMRHTVDRHGRPVYSEAGIRKTILDGDLNTLTRMQSEFTEIVKATVTTLAGKIRAGTYRPPAPETPDRTRKEVVH